MIGLVLYKMTHFTIMLLINISGSSGGKKANVNLP